ncbi:hypothetical protein CHS0354_024602 [Potamilus streckersoni]|uniref:Link domain-containing protein n=1 Tax=Potamilus streckersoni TaxID=2493646 RepID=A0AAE0SUE4_9BIVA|nr:hypothetical protein CHS0354_024602 [Potamilus streckersoni]
MRNTGTIIRFVPARFNETTFSFDDARKACKNIASKTDIRKAVQLGDKSCACGWLSDRTMEALKPKVAVKNITAKVLYAMMG